MPASSKGIVETSYYPFSCFKGTVDETYYALACLKGIIEASYYPFSAVKEQAIERIHKKPTVFKSSRWVYHLYSIRHTLRVLHATFPNLQRVVQVQHFYYQTALISHSIVCRLLQTCLVESLDHYLKCHSFLV